ncbi:MAG: phosphoenolpyruvate--protein phosphotransferase [Cardiobacteriaceae bacterium]|nr:phosphoenolpyruvate--protein phosphotransferase [Cardiobacteriaceae bacterium]
MEILKGLPVSQGISIATAWLYIPKTPAVESRTVSSSQVKYEIAAFRAAQEEVEAHQRRIYEKTLKRLGEKNAEIFAAHIEMLRDEEFEKDVLNLIEKRRYTAMRAVKEYLDEAAAIMRNLPDPFLRERAGEFQDLQTNLLLAISHLPFTSLAKAPKDSLVIAHDLTPSETALIETRHIKGIVLSAGGLTGHVAILARNSGIPSVMGVPDVLAKVKNGDTVIIDGGQGEVIIDPDEETLNTYRAKKAEEEKLQQEYRELHGTPAETVDGQRVNLYSNIASPSDLYLVEENGSEGIGLFRSEFLFMKSSVEPGEEEQFDAYRKVLINMGERPVILRLADIGGDKNLPYIDIEKEANPFLGCRGVRLYKKYRDIFETQICAALRAAVSGNLRLMIPMVTSVEEVLFVREEVMRQAARLKRLGKNHNANIPIGVMIETPAAALIAPQLAKVSSFFSIGSNDLTQYVLAVDRSNIALSDMYDNLHPAVLRCIKLAVDAAKKEKIEVGVCGEIAGQMTAVPLLVGMGIDELSISGKRVGAVKRLIRGLDAAKCRGVLGQVLELDNGKLVRELIKQEFSL